MKSKRLLTNIRSLPPITLRKEALNDCTIVKGKSFNKLRPKVNIPFRKIENSYSYKSMKRLEKTYKIIDTDFKRRKLCLSKKFIMEHPIMKLIAHNGRNVKAHEALCENNNGVLKQLKTFEAVPKFYEMLYNCI